MYKAFYGLNANPFDISPDPKFFYGTPRHNEALAILYHGIERRKGFIVVTGEVGTGKTLLARCLFQSLQWQKISFAYVFNPLLSTLEFLRYSLNDLGLVSAGKSKGELLAELNRHLIARHRQSSTTALIIDEAQLLSWELLEEVRLLTNLETAQQKLLQIVLIGQPELDEKLESQDLRQLKQRIALRCRLEPLSQSDTRQYITSRLWAAGAKERSKAIFPDATVELIHGYSNGIPRLVNTICEAALIEGLTAKTQTISPEIVDAVAADFRLRTVRPSPADGKAVMNADSLEASRAVAKAV
jgi:general secretion pathway protein A